MTPLIYTLTTRQMQRLAKRYRRPKRGLASRRITIRYGEDP